MTLDLTYKILALVAVSFTVLGVLTGIILVWLKDKFVEKKDFEQFKKDSSTDLVNLEKRQTNAEYELKSFNQAIADLKSWLGDKLMEQDKDMTKEILHLSNNVKQYVNSNTSSITKLMQMEDELQAIKERLAAKQI